MSLLDQPWYWGNIPKQQVAEMLQSKPDGSFLVRDASSPGDYTLSIRYLGQTKLVRIHVSGDKCGFAPDALTHNSVVQLVDFHRLRSLKVYNEQLDTCLRYPVNRRRKSNVSESSNIPAHNRSTTPAVLSRENSKVRLNTRSPSSTVAPPSVSGVPSSSFDFPTHETLPPVQLTANENPEWQRRLGLERLRIAQTASVRAARLYDLAHEELLKAQQLEKAQERALEDLDRKLEIMNDVRDVQLHSKENLELSDSMKQTMIPNSDVVKKYVEMLATERAIVQSQVNRLLEAKTLLNSQRDKAKARLMACHQENNKVFLSLRNSDFPADLLNETSDKAEEMVKQAETTHVSQILADMSMNWNPARFLVNESNKDVAASLIQQARARITQASRSMGAGQTPPQGIFLIRPSASQPAKLVLSVLNGDRVSHCLIEQTDQGWGFENGGLYFVTIGDFVRYYTHTSLVEHNPEINTFLTVPALPAPSGSSKSPKI